MSRGKGLGEGLNSKKERAATLQRFQVSFRPVVLEGKQAEGSRGGGAGGQGLSQGGLASRTNPKFRLLLSSTHEVMHTVTGDTVTNWKEAWTSLY